MKKEIVFVFLLLCGISLIAAAECGDVNSDGTVDIVDALLISQYYVNLNPGNFDSSVADVNSDNSIDIVDALLIAQFYVNLIDELNCQDSPTPTPFVEETVFAVNCGGSAYTASDGTVYAADTGFSGGSAYTNGASVSGTSDPTLYSTERYGSCSYSASVPNGEFRVMLHFAENYHTSSGLRVFNVNIEGTGYINNLDVYATVGNGVAYVTEDQVTVSDGEINIEFVTVTENALINAIKVDAIAFTGEPIVKFTVNPQNPKPGETVTVDASASYDPDGTISNHQVNYGDDYITNGSVTNHSYANAGPYTITVTVTDNEGKTASKSEDILVSEEPPPGTYVKPRYIATSDLGADPDDEMSWVHYLVSMNEFEVVACVSGTSCWKKSQTSTAMLDAKINAYEQAYNNLKVHSPDFPTPAYLRSVRGLGQTGYSMGDVGSGKDSFGSNAIIAAADDNDPRPVWIGCWGGANTVAQAVWKVQNTRSSSEVAQFISRIRVYDILGQDDCGAWMTKNYPNLLYIRFIGVYSWQYSDSWIDQNVQNHGPLGATYPDRVWANEGDTPAFMYVMPNGLSDPDQVTWGSWGGRCNGSKKANVRGMSAVTAESQYDTYYMYSDAPEGGGSISKWSSDIANDFAARMDWSITSNYSGANHHPIAILNNDSTRNVLRISASAGSSITLSAVGSSDPDGNNLSYSWSYYAEPSSAGSPSISGSTSSTATVSVSSGVTHIILKVSDNGSPSLCAYRRAVITAN
ncbi:MAG: DUF1593 domain-containing protein [Spirochaetales bacterium]|nr:DUF1593 domain-containing protein [Spirochaetales bacterium]